MKDFDPTLRELILRHVPADGSPIANEVLRALLGQALNMQIAPEDYRRVCDVLISEGLLSRGRGRGGSVMRTSPQAAGQEDAGEERDDAPLLTMQEAPPPRAPVVRNTPAADAAPRAKPGDTAQVLSYRHGDKRKNNPHVGMVDTASDGVEEETRWAYDPHIDPALNFDSARARIENLIDDALSSGDADVMRLALHQLKRMQAPYLNWTGKAERTSFEVDTVSLHVHERIDPATILAAIQRQSGKLQVASGKKNSPLVTRPLQLGIFSAPFENLPLREAIAFYKHERDWANRLIAGDSLLVMNSLLQKESMAGQVQMIYIDPPYGIKYGSNFQPFTHKRDVKDRKDEDLTQEPEMIKAFRDTWELGIHSYLTYLRDRLLLAKELLHESGSVFVQISDENLHHVREVMDEVFGASHFSGLINYKKTTSASTTRLASVCDYVVWYFKNPDKAKYRQLYLQKLAGEQGGGQYTWAEFADGQRRNVGLRKVIELDDEIRIFRQDNLASQRPAQGDDVREFLFQGRSFSPGKGTFKTDALGLKRLSRSKRLIALGSTLSYVRFLDDFPVFPINNFWDDTVTSGFSDQKVYVVQTNPSAIERCLLMTTDPGDLVLDPTCGSGTTAFVAEKWGRRWITCDTSRVAVTLAKQRLLTASYDYYELKYPHEGLKGGFIYKTVPHVTLKSIANNPEIDEIYERMHPAVEKALADLNAALSPSPQPLSRQGRGALHVHRGDAAGEHQPPSHQGKGALHPSPRAGEGPGERGFNEWEIPFDFPADWPESARAPFDAFHAARQAMQRQMDASIAAHADQETLYDQPQVSKSKLRITGPFTVEAVPFATVLQLDEAEQPQVADVAVARSGETSRQSLWRDELLKTGIRGKGGQILRLADLEPLPGARYIHAVGTTVSGEGQDGSDKGRVASGEKNLPLTTSHSPLTRVAVSFGPEHAALEQRQVEIAMREAGELFPLPKMLVFCAFTFDPEAAKDIDTIKGITALKVQMNTDLLTEDLKKARAGNQSFWLMGQPEVEVMKDEWLVASNGEALMPYGIFKELSGLDRLEEIDGLGRSGLSGKPELSEGGALRSDQPDTASSSVGSIEYRRRAIAELHRRLLAVSGNRQRIAGGVGNADVAGPSDRLSDGHRTATASSASGGGRQAHSRIDARAQLQAVTASHLPLTTRHLYQVEVHGFDYFDTVSGELKSGGKKQITLWALDTDYDNRSLYPRQVFFPMAGAKDGWYKLKKDIRAELDEDLLEQFHGTVSLPFEAGDNRCIAVKIVDDRGIESLKVITLD